MRQKEIRLALLTAGSALLLSGPVLAQEWTRFRGPNGSGVSSATTVPVEFSEKDYNWKITLPGPGHSSPVLWGKKIFLTSAEPENGKRHVLCINAADGKVLWTKTYPFANYAKHTYNSYASGSPAVDADAVYVMFATPESFAMYALDHNGKELWQRDLGDYTTQHGGASSPIVVGDVVLISKEPDERPGALYGLNRKTGAVLWQRPRLNKSAPYATPIVYQAKGGAPEVVFTSTGHGVTSLDPKTGDLNWEVPDVFRSRCVGSPILLANGLILGTAGNGGGDKQAVLVRPAAKQAGTAAKVEHQLTKGLTYVPTPIAYKDLVFLWGDGGIVTCIKADTAEQVWMERIGGNYFGSPVCINGKLYGMSAKGDLLVVDAADKFKLLATIPLGEPSHSTPAVADGVLYLRTMSHLISVGGKK